MNIEKSDILYSLFNVYGGLLTTRQRQVMEMYLLYDNTLVEIAEEIHVSRQAVYNIINDSSLALYHFEEVLKMRQMLDEMNIIGQSLKNDGLLKYAKSIEKLIKNNKKS